MKRFKLPDGTMMPLQYKVPAASDCKIADPAHCQHAEGMRAVGFRDPKVLPGDKMVIQAVHGEYRLVFPVNGKDVLPSVGKFDAGKGEAKGKEYTLPRPLVVRKIQKRGPNSKKRKDAGMTKAKADKKFKRKPGNAAGRRSHTIKFSK